MTSFLGPILGIILTTLAVGLYVSDLGDSFLDNTDKAAAAQYRAEAEQIVSALTLYKIEQGSFEEGFTLADLAPEYLKALPAGDWSTDSINNRITRTGLTNNQCAAANEAAGYIFQMSDMESANYVVSEKDSDYGVPMCSWESIPDGVPCCYEE